MASNWGKDWRGPFSSGKYEYNKERNELREWGTDESGKSYAQLTNIKKWKKPVMSSDMAPKGQSRAVVGPEPETLKGKFKQKRFGSKVLFTQ